MAKPHGSMCLVSGPNFSDVRVEPDARDHARSAKQEWTHRLERSGSRRWQATEQRTAECMMIPSAD